MVFSNEGEDTLSVEKDYHSSPGNHTNLSFHIFPSILLTLFSAYIVQHHCYLVPIHQHHHLFSGRSMQMQEVEGGQQRPSTKTHTYVGE